MLVSFILIVNYDWMVVSLKINLIIITHADLSFTNRNDIKWHGCAKLLFLSLFIDKIFSLDSYHHPGYIYSNKIEFYVIHTFLPAAPTFAFFVPRTFFIRFFFSLACFHEFLGGLSITPCRPNLYLGSNFFAKSKVS